MTMRSLTLVLIGAALCASACTVSQSEQGDLTGPSTFGTSLTMTVTPDVINLGQSALSPGQSSLVVVNVFDEHGQPKPNQEIRLDLLVGQIVEDCGQLQARVLTTDRNGQASTFFTAPGNPVPLPECTSFVAGDSVTIRATPVGNNAQSLHSTSADVRLMSPTFVTPVGGLTVNFTISPNPGKVNQAISFNDAGSASPGHEITSYHWTFSDGASKNGASVTHDFGAAGEYTVTLTVTDDIFQTSFKSATVTITN
jgi:hypothetical protein